MNRETVRLTLLAEVLEMGWNNYIKDYALDELDAFLDREKAVELAQALRREFSLDNPLEEITENGFFRGYLAGLLLTSDSISYERKVETAGILLEKLLSDLKEADDSLPSMNDSSRSTEKVEKILFPDISDSGRKRSKRRIEDNLRVFWCFSKRDYFIPLILWGNELASFLCEAVDEEKFEGEWGEKLRKIVPLILSSNSVASLINSLGGDFPMAESFVSSFFPMLALIRNKKITSKQVSEFILGISHLVIVNYLFVPTLMAAGGSAEEKSRGIEVINEIFASIDDRNLVESLNLSNAASRNAFFYEVVKSNDFSKVFGRLKSLLESGKKEDFPDSLMAIASALAEKEESRENVKEFIDYLMTLKHSVEASISGILLCKKYGFEQEKLFKKKTDKIYKEADHSLLLLMAKRPFGFLEDFYEDVDDELKRRMKLEDIISNIEEMFEPSLIECEDDDLEIEYSRPPMYTLMNSVVEQNDEDASFDAIAAYCKKYPYNFEFVNFLMATKAEEPDHIRKLLFEAGERAYEIISSIVVDEDEDIYLKESGESLSNTEFLNVINNYIDRLIAKKDYRRVAKIADTVLPLLGYEDSKELLANSLIAHWRQKDYKKLPELFEEVDDESDPKSFVVMALMSYVNKEIDDAERIILGILEQLPHFIQFMLGNEELSGEDFKGARNGDDKSLRKLDAMYLAEEFREDWFKLKGAKDWLRKVQQIFNEVNTEF